MFEFNAGPYYALKQIGVVVTGQDLSKQLGPTLALLYGIVLVATYALDQRRRFSFPTIGLWGIGAFIALVAAVVASIFGFLWFPLKRLLRGLRGRQEGMPDIEDSELPASTSSSTE